MPSARFLDSDPGRCPIASNESVPLQLVAQQLAAFEARVLIVDDDAPMIAFLESLLRPAGLQVQTTSDPRETLLLFHAFQPDLVILDLRMPHLDGFQVMQKLFASVPDTQYVPILVITADQSLETKLRAMSAGARDFLNKPFDNVEALLRVRNLLEARFLTAHVHQKNQQLQARVKERSNRLLEAQGEAIERIAEVVEFHDDASGQHTRRVADLAAEIAARLDLSFDEVDLIRKTAPLHDVGKIGIPDLILLRPDRLTPEEYELMKMHTSIGARILAGGQSEFLERAEQIAHFHHERWDGLGYPRQLRGEEIPLAARIVAVADFYDSLTHDRPYRAAWPEERVLEEIDGASGSRFDPQVADAFLRIRTQTDAPPRAE